MKIVIHPIGIIYTPYKQLKGIPCQAYKSKKTGRIKVYKQFAEGLDDIDGFSHIILLYYLHKARGYKLKAKPFLDDVPHGVFAIRWPYRPNHIGISTVRLLKRQGRELVIEGVDMLDNTPLLDIKPYVPTFDNRTNVRTGWYKGKSKIKTKIS